MEQPHAVLEAVNQLSTTITHFTATRYVVFAGYILMLYDHATTFSDEVELIWMKPMKPVSRLFLLNRYGAPIILAIDFYDKGGFATNLPQKFCEIWLWIEGYCLILFFSVTHGLVALRVRALWLQSPNVNWSLGVAFMLYLTSTIAIVTLGNIPLSADIHFDQYFQMCFSDKLAHWLYWAWIPALLFEAVLFVLTVIKAVQHHKRNMVMPVTRILYRDGVLYFLVIALFTAFNIIAWTALPSTLIGLAKYFSIVTMMGSKLVLNMRAIRKEDDIMAQSLQAVSTNPPVFELSALKTFAPQRNEHLSFGAPPHAIPDIYTHRAVHFETRHKPKMGLESSEWFGDGDSLMARSIKSVHIQCVDNGTSNVVDWNVEVDGGVDGQGHDRC